MMRVLILLATVVLANISCIAERSPEQLIVDYLEINYNPEVGLYREAPNVAPNTYWVYSDGYLAIVTLKEM